MYSLRDLPTPAKLVISCFLCAVGLGYFSAMVQLHLQHSARDGDPLPNKADVVEIFAGWKTATEADKDPKSKLQVLIMGPIEGAPFNGSGSMAAAFYTKDSDYKSAIKDDPSSKDSLDKERRGEQVALDEWLKLPEPERKKAFTDNKLPIPAALKDQPITADFLTEDKKAIKVQELFDTRCTRCHKEGGDAASFRLETYEEIAKYAVVKKVEIVDGMVRSERQIGIEKLTQSTHAHLLSFAMLFSLTGLTFAFTSWNVKMRCLVAPMVVVAQVADVSCWWLARIDGVGPLFATAIIFTGTAVALGLVIQIFGSLWDMWTGKSRILMLFIVAVGLAGLGALVVKAIVPALEAEKAAKKV
ncbi:MAG: hypothetical protein JNK93_08640 [Planctomycetia bacterium]|nr:hypothetical protein [Planctomycetia bacterium]